MLDVRLMAWTLVLAVLAAGVARADDELEARGVGPTPAQLVARVELQQALGTKVEVRWDPASGCPRSVRFERPVGLEAAEPVAAARELLVRLEPLFGRLAVEDGPRSERGGVGGQEAAPRDPRLRHTATTAYGKERHVRFDQAVGDVPLDGAEVVVTLARRDGKTVAVRVSGRVFKDAPAVLPPAPAPAQGARRLLTLRPDGVWKVADEAVEVPARGPPVAVLRGLDGAVLARRPFADEGAASATVWPRWLEQGTARRPLRDLTLLAGDRVVTTGDDGGFPGTRAELPWGLSGPLERVVPWSGRPYPAAQGGRLALTFGADDARAAEVNVFHHLVEVRRFYATIPGLDRGFFERQTVAQLSTGDFNAWCLNEGLTIEGKRFEHALTFGHGMGLDAFVVAHERTHALVNALGLRSGGGGDARTLHEALADYLAAVYTGDPTFRGGAGGHLGRRIDEDRVYPQDYHGGEAHHDSLIFSGALWDARGAAGKDAALVDAAAARLVPALGSGPSLRSAARTLLEGAAAEVHPALETHLRRHGLLDDPDAPPPALGLRCGEANERLTGFAIAAGAEQPLVLTAWDPAEREAGRPAKVTLLVDGLPFAARRKPAEQAAQAAAEATFDLRPREADVGDHVLTVVAESQVSGKTTTRTWQVVVLPAGAPRGDLAPVTTVIHLAVGERRAIPARALFPGLPDGYRFETSGQLSAGAALVDGHLTLAPEPGDEGFHRFSVHALLAATSRDPRSEPVCDVVVRVGPAEGPWLEVTRLPVAGEQGGRSDEVLPGQRLVVHAGEKVELRAWAQLAASSGVAGPTPRLECERCGAWRFDPSAPSCERCGAPVPPVPPPPPPSRVRLTEGPAWVTSSERHTMLDLTVAPPAGGPRRATFTLVVAREGEAPQAARTVEVIIIPAPRPATPGAEPTKPVRGFADVIRELGR